MSIKVEDGGPFTIIVLLYVHDVAFALVAQQPPCTLYTRLPVKRRRRRASWDLDF